MRYNSYRVVEMFEETVADYAGAPYAVAVSSCTDALFLSCTFAKVGEVTIPARTYLSVPQSVIHAGGSVKFEDRTWSGVYQLLPYPIHDGAKRFEEGMFLGGFHCLSFHINKHLPIGKGGMILTDNSDAVEWFRRARYEGRQAVPMADARIHRLGWNLYMTPEQAARGLMLMQSMPDRNPDLVEDYPDLRKHPLFSGCA